MRGIYGTSSPILIVERRVLLETAVFPVFLVSSLNFELDNSNLFTQSHGALVDTFDTTDVIASHRQPGDRPDQIHTKERLFVANSNHSLKKKNSV